MESFDINLNIQEKPRNKNTSRRLKHKYFKHYIFIKNNNIQNIDKIIFDNINDYIHLHKKYELKGHTKKEDLKGYDLDLKYQKYADGFHRPTP
jgi:hypothetical protein